LNGIHEILKLVVISAAGLRITC